MGTRKHPQPPIRPPRQRHTAPDQDHPSRQRRAYAGKSPPSIAKFHVCSSRSARSTRGSASQLTLRSPSYAGQSSAENRLPAPRPARKRTL